MAGQTDNQVQLEDWRDRIDDIDSAIIDLLAERFKVTKEIGLYKRLHGLPTVDKSREEAQTKQIAQKANDAGLDPEFAQKVLRLSIDETVKNYKHL